MVEIVAEKLEVNHRNFYGWKSFISIDTELEIPRKGNRILMKFADNVTLVKKCHEEVKASVSLQLLDIL